MFFDTLDEFLDAFRTENIARSEEKNPLEEEDIIDELLDLFLLAYYDGSKEAARELSMDITPSIEDARASIERPVAGKTYQDRVRDYVNGNMGETTGTPAEAIARVAETEAIRIYNEAGLSTAHKLGATTKTWNTMEDYRVRDQHVLLDGVSVPLDGYFYTYTGDKAQQPCGFETAENNVNCRCWLTFNK